MYTTAKSILGTMTAAPAAQVAAASPAADKNTIDVEARPKL